ncbi:MAG: FMN-binding protein [Peptostreptococcaceae bacterium]|jgi:major membrane immunogen (membrane-anchored lipoprotein)|nr:FMN-binding protein [Peptostreptococcaceae bacterium]
MKFNNFKKGILVGALSLMLLTGCGAKEVSYQDGTYKGEYKDFDKHGWKPFIEVTIKEGKIDDVKFDYKNEEDKLKSADEEYSATYKKVAGVTPTESYAKMIEDIKEKQDSQIDTVSGATGSTNNFKTLAQEVLKNAQEGKTDLTVVEPDESN